MTFELFDSWSLASIIAEHFEDKILEFWREILSTGLLPILIKLSVQDKIVEVLIFLGLLEWENTLNNDEKDNSCREHVDLFTVIGFSFFDFRSHIGHSTSVRIQFIDSLVSSESEISHFKVHVVVNQNVLKFQVSVDDSFALHVAHNFNHLRQEISAVVFAHTTDGLAQIEEEPAFDVLKEDVNEVRNFSSRRFFNMSIWAVTKNIDNVAMLQSLENLDFLFDWLDGVSISLEELFSQKFKGNFVSVLQRLSQVNFRSVTFSEGGEDLELVVENWVLLFTFHSVVLMFFCKN